MKKKCPLFLLALVSSQVLASQVITVSRFEIGKANWPFSREEVMLTCLKDGAMFVINPSTLAEYPLNVLAQQRVASGISQGEPISRIQLDAAAKPGQKKSLQAIVSKTRKLCTGPD